MQTVLCGSVSAMSTIKHIMVFLIGGIAGAVVVQCNSMQVLDAFVMRVPNAAYQCATQGAGIIQLIDAYEDRNGSSPRRLEDAMTTQVSRKEWSEWSYAANPPSWRLSKRVNLVDCIVEVWHDRESPTAGWRYQIVSGAVGYVSTNRGPR
jgi:hypothetical protein